MSLSKPIQWYHSHAELIWPDGTFKNLVVLETNECLLNFACCTAECLLHELLWPKVARVYRASFRFNKNKVGISSRLPEDQKLVMFLLTPPDPNSTLKVVGNEN
jgi:hypothetical protein